MSSFISRVPRWPCVPPTTAAGASQVSKLPMDLLLGCTDVVAGIGNLSWIEDSKVRSGKSLGNAVLPRLAVRYPAGQKEARPMAGVFCRWSNLNHGILPSRSYLEIRLSNDLRRARPSEGATFEGRQIPLDQHHLEVLLVQIENNAV